MQGWDARRTTELKMADSHAKHHDYHLVDPSPWPVLASLSAFVLAVGFIIWMRSMGGGPGLFGINGSTVFFIGAASLIAVAFLWWRDVVREAHKGDHTSVMRLHLRYVMILFVASEVMFVVARVWAYIDAAHLAGGASPLAVLQPDGTVVPSERS